MDPATTLFYYVRDNKNRPVVTVGLFLSEGIIVRGIAKCSKLDLKGKKVPESRLFSKENGRDIVKGRILKAIELKTLGKDTTPENPFLLISNRQVKKELEKIGLLLHEEIHTDKTVATVPCVLKAEINPNLTEFEKQILGEKRLKLLGL